MKGADTENILSNQAPKSKKVKYRLVPFFYSSKKCILPSKFETLTASPFLP
jgi:hypothetical protein